MGNPHFVYFERPSIELVKRFPYEELKSTNNSAYWSLITTLGNIRSPSLYKKLY